MTCIQCGAPLNAGDPFCPKCGARQSVGLSVPSEPQRAALERVLGHQYDILRLLGRGGMGAVYLAREKALERAVAIKVLPPETATDADSRERFRREARVAAKLTHPNIVPLLTFGDVEGMLYFVMGYVKGESLAERMRREGKLPEEDVRRILAEVADALHYAHKQGVVHRDIKPDNVLLEDESGRPMLTDFGVAKAKASGTTLTEAGAVVGTPYYMSPEQASGVKEIDGRSDLYSLGVMGYQMMSGRLPFEGESFQDVLVQHVTQEPAPLAALVPEVAPDLTAAVMRCLKKEPAKRWDGAGGLRDAIRAGTDAAEDDESAPGFYAHTLLFTCVAMVFAVGVLALALLLIPGLRLVPGMEWWLMPATMGAGIPPIALLIVLFERRRGTPWQALRREALIPPRWWPFWWPEAWRRPRDVWLRLPTAMRRVRALTGWGALALAVALFVEGFLSGLENRFPEGWETLAGALGLTGLFTVLGSMWFVQRWGDARGLRRATTGHLQWASTMNAQFWGRPEIATLLLPPTGRSAAARVAEPKSPADLAHAIRELVSQLPSDPRATVSEAGDVARQVAELVASLDAELANLARDADPQELEALEAKLRALGPEAAGEGEVRRQKRALLVNQRDLLRQLDQRLASVNDRRAKLVEMLRTMWLQLATLRAEAAHDTLAVTEISGRITALCADIDAHLKAAETVRVELR